MEKDAEATYQAEASLLQQKLAETERQLQDLQRQKPADAGSNFLLSPEQQAALKKFEAERAATRKQLRGVQFNLKHDIEKLGTLLKVLNIAVMPLLVSLFAIGLGLYRISRRGGERRNVAKAE